MKLQKIWHSALPAAYKKYKSARDTGNIAAEDHGMSRTGNHANASAFVCVNMHLYIRNRF
jgi:hypothetical protein